MAKLTKAEAARLNGKKGGRPRKARAPSKAETPAPPPTQPVDAPGETPTLDNPFDLTPKELLFVEAYCGVANFCAIKAYEVAGYSMRGIQSTRYANAVKVLGKPKIQQAIETKLAARIRRVRVMDGDEALERLTLYARADIGKVLAPEDPLAKLPDDVRLTIKAVRPNQFGRVIELYDSMKATELLAKADGKLKDTIKVEHTLEEIMALSNRLPATTPGKGAAA